MGLSRRLYEISRMFARPVNRVQFSYSHPASSFQEVQVPFRAKGAVMFDLQGRIAFASTAFCDLVGVEHDRVARMSYLDFVFAEDIPEAKTIFELPTAARPRPFRFRLRRSDGVPVWVDIQGAALQTAAGEVYAISATVTAAEAPPS